MKEPIERFGVKSGSHLVAYEIFQSIQSGVSDGKSYELEQKPVASL